MWYNFVGEEAFACEAIPRALGSTYLEFNAIY
jgi:hypothetical protein